MKTKPAFDGLLRWSTDLLIGVGVLRSQAEESLPVASGVAKAGLILQSGAAWMHRGSDALPGAVIDRRREDRFVVASSTTPSAFFFIFLVTAIFEAG